MSAEMQDKVEKFEDLMAWKRSAGLSAVSGRQWQDEGKIRES